MLLALVLGLAATAAAQESSSSDPFLEAGAFNAPPTPGGRSVLPAGAYGGVPGPNQFNAAQWGEEVAPGLGGRPQGDVGYARMASTSSLDPNVAMPQQSLGEYAEGPVIGQPMGHGAPCDACAENVICGPCGPLKTLRFQTTWLSGDDLGFTDVELWSKWDFATISEYSILTLTPGYGLHLVDGPAAPDLPAQLHDLYLDIQWINPFSREWAVELGLTPGLYSDFENGTDDAFRLGARIVGYYTMSPVWRFAAGVAYLDREDVEFFPLGGVIWTPDDNTRLELVLPRPKYAQRFNQCGGCEDWWYVAGEFGGGSWAIERAAGGLDKANYYDWRFAIGWERRSKAGPTVLAELGYVFNRRLEYNSGGGTFEPDDTFMLRGMLGF
jgi:hypothetical protein